MMPVTGCVVVYFHLAPQCSPVLPADCLRAVPAEWIDLTVPGSILTENHICSALIEGRSYPCIVMKYDRVADLAMMQEWLNRKLTDGPNAKFVQKALCWAKDHETNGVSSPAQGSGAPPQQQQPPVPSRRTSLQTIASSSHASPAKLPTGRNFETLSPGPLARLQSPSVSNTVSACSTPNLAAYMQSSASLDAVYPSSSRSPESGFSEDMGKPAEDWLSRLDNFAIPAQIRTNDGEAVDKETFFNGFAGADWRKAIRYAVAKLFTMNEFMDSEALVGESDMSWDFDDAALTTDHLKLLTLFVLIVHYRKRDAANGNPTLRQIQLGVQSFRNQLRSSLAYTLDGMVGMDVD